MRAGPTPEVQKARALLADDIVRRARAGEDFCELVTEYSDDTQTNQSCGSRGPPLDREPREGGPGRHPPAEAGRGDRSRSYSENGIPQATLIVQVHTAPIPSFEEMKDQMMDRAFGEGMEQQRKLWLADLRRAVFVDVRL